jgi:hypothetical protein
MQASDSVYIVQDDKGFATAFHSKDEAVKYRNIYNNVKRRFFIAQLMVNDKAYNAPKPASFMVDII